MQVIRISSTIVLLFARLFCLVVAIDGDFENSQYGLIIERMPSLYEDWALNKRDVCAEAIPGTVTSTCTPGNTLCCIPNNTGTAFPQCQTILGSGYCCTSNNNCYVDTPSDCAVSNSVACTMLVEGISEACCPPFTICPTNFNQSSTVRCNLVQGSSSSSTTSPSSSKTTSSSTKNSSSSGTTTSSSILASDTLSPVTITSSSASSTPTGSSATSSNNPSLSARADAGIGVGVAIAAFVLISIIFVAFRQYRKRGRERKTAEAETALGTQMSPGIEHQQYYDPTKYSDVPQQGFEQYNKHQLPTATAYARPAELGDEAGRHELP